jgi:fucose 4-O-acetylase-like acetyltransferase
VKQINRSGCIDTLRGFACILLVLYHSIVVLTPPLGSELKSGLYIAKESFWQIPAELFIYIRMPLFAFLSGYVYNLRPFVGNHNHFLVGKARHLLLPMFVGATFFAIAQSIYHGTSFGIRSWIELVIYPIIHFWFLEALFLIFVIVMILESLKLLSSREKLAGILAFAIVIQLTVAVPNIFSLWGVVYLLPYFLFGIACSRYSLHETHSLYLSVSVAVLLCAYVYAVMGFFNYVPIPPRTSIVALLIGITAPFIFISFNWSAAALIYIGQSSYAIFLYHYIIVTVTRIVYRWWQFTDLDALILLSTATGILGSMLIETFAKRWAFTRTVLLGQRWTTSPGSAHVPIDTNSRMRP